MQSKRSSRIASRWGTGSASGATWTSSVAYTPARRLIVSGPPARLVVVDTRARGGGAADRRQPARLASLDGLEGAPPLRRLTAAAARSRAGPSLRARPPG